MNSGTSKIIVAVILAIIFAFAFNFLKTIPSFFGFPLTIVFIIIFLLLRPSITAYIQDLKNEGRLENFLNVDEILEKRYEKPILYLRPFIGDNSIEIIEGTFKDGVVEENYERYMLLYLNQIGPLIALSNPRKNYIGVPKVSVEGQDWKKVFWKYSGMSQYIIWTWGISDSMIWELNELLTQQLTKVIIFFSPEGITEENRQVLWKATLTKLEMQYETVGFLPENIGQTRFILYDYQKNYTLISPTNVTIKRILRIGCYEEIQDCLKKLRSNISYSSIMAFNRDDLPVFIFYFVMLWCLFLFSSIEISILFYLLFFIVFYLIFYFSLSSINRQKRVKRWAIDDENYKKIITEVRNWL